MYVIFRYMTVHIFQSESSMMKLSWYNPIVCLWVTAAAAAEMATEDWRFMNNTGCSLASSSGNWLHPSFIHNLFFSSVSLHLEVPDISFASFLEVRLVLPLCNVSSFTFAESNMLSWTGDFIGWTNPAAPMSGSLAFVNKTALSSCRSFLFFLAAFKSPSRFSAVDAGWPQRRQACGWVRVTKIRFF